MTDLKFKYSELCNELYRNFIYYVPLSVLDMEEFEDIHNDLRPNIDKVICFDDNLIIVEKSIDSTTLLNKSIRLQNNCFKLIGYKDTLGNSSFNYLSINYFKQLQSFTNLSILLSNSFEDNFPTKDKGIQTLFNSQSLVFKTHLAEVEEITGLKTQNLEQKVNDKPLFKDFSSQLPKGSKSKKVKFTKEDAIEYLLATVFKPKN